MDELLDPKLQFSWLKDSLNLKLENRIYITGSFLTYLIESEYRTPSWFPNDIDICCHPDLFKEIDIFLKSKSSKIDRRKNNTFYHIPEFTRISVCPTTTDFKQRVPWSDYSVIALTSVGDEFYMDEFTRQDIKDKKLRPIGLFGDPRCDRHILDRYRKYIKRGFIDQDNIVFESILQFFREKNIRKNIGIL